MRCCRFGRLVSNKRLDRTGDTDDRRLPKKQRWPLRPSSLARSATPEPELGTQRTVERRASDAMRKLLKSISYSSKSFANIHDALVSPLFQELRGEGAGTEKGLNPLVMVLRTSRLKK